MKGKYMEILLKMTFDVFDCTLIDSEKEEFHRHNPGFKSMYLSKQNISEIEFCVKKMLDFMEKKKVGPFEGEI